MLFLNSMKLIVTSLAGTIGISSLELEWEACLHFLLLGALFQWICVLYVCRDPSEVEVQLKKKKEKKDHEQGWKKIISKYIHVPILQTQSCKFYNKANCLSSTAQVINFQLLTDISIFPWLSKSVYSFCCCHFFLAWKFYTSIKNYISQHFIKKRTFRQHSAQHEKRFLRKELSHKHSNRCPDPKQEWVT